MAGPVACEGDAGLHDRPSAAHRLPHKTRPRAARPPCSSRHRTPGRNEKAPPVPTGGASPFVTGWAAWHGEPNRPPGVRRACSATPASAVAWRRAGRARAPPGSTSRGPRPHVRRDRRRRRAPRSRSRRRAGWAGADRPAPDATGSGRRRSSSPTRRTRKPASVARSVVTHGHELVARKPSGARRGAAHGSARAHSRASDSPSSAGGSGAVAPSGRLSAYRTPPNRCVTALARADAATTSSVMGSSR